MRPAPPDGFASRWCSKCGEWHPAGTKMLLCLACAIRCSRLAPEHRQQRQHYPPYYFTGRLFRFNLDDGRVVRRPVCFGCYSDRLEHYPMEHRVMPVNRSAMRSRPMPADDISTGDTPAEEGSAIPHDGDGDGSDRVANNRDAIAGLVITGQTVSHDTSSGVQLRVKPDNAPTLNNDGASWDQLQMELAYPAWAFDRWCEQHPKIAETFIAAHAGVVDLVSLWALTTEPRGEAYAAVYAIAKASDRQRFRRWWKTRKPRNDQQDLELMALLAPTTPLGAIEIAGSGLIGSLQRSSK